MHCHEKKAKKYPKNKNKFSAVKKNGSVALADI
jgi:hypothetical protein